MSLHVTIAATRKMLTECAVSERLRRIDAIELHPTLFLTPLIYDPLGRQQLQEIYRQYRQTALDASLPMLLCAPTWRLDRMRLEEAGYDHRLIGDAVTFLRKLQNGWQHQDSPLFIGGYIGPKNDCYSPELGLSADEAEQFHGWQAERLAESGVDCVVSQTLPTVAEATGIARALAACSLPAIISFVINRHGEVLDSTPLAEAIEMIDSQTLRPPLGYMVNCVYPSFLCAEEQPPGLFKRLIGIQANSSSLDHSELDGSKTLHRDDLQHWGESMLRLNRRYGVKILGGCCGTDNSHLRFLAEND